MKIDKPKNESVYHTPHKGFNINLDINSDSKINLLGINLFLQNHIYFIFKIKH